MHARTCGFAVALLGVVAASAQAAGTWTATAPVAGGFTDSVAYSADGTTAFAGGIGLVYRSTDDGAHWTAAALPAAFASSLVLAVAPDPKNSAIVLASTTDIAISGTAQGDNVLYSDNGGVTWKLATGLPNQVSSGNTQYPYNLAWDPRSAAVYAATAAGETGDIYASADKGKTWTLRYFMSTTSKPKPFGPIIAVPTNPTSIYIAANDFNYSSDGDEFIAKSVDAGHTFNVVEPLDYVGFSGYGQVLTRFAYDPVKPAVTYAMVSGEQSNTFTEVAPYIKFLWTPNKGVNWVNRVAGLPANSLASAVAVDPASQAVLLQVCCTTHHQLFQSINEGAKWTALSVIPASSLALAVKPGVAEGTPMTLLNAGRGGVLASTDGGATWADRNTGLKQPNFTDVLADPTTPTTLYVGTKAGVMRSTNGGQTFKSISVGLTDGNVASLAIDAKAASHVVYAATLSGIYRCANPTAANPVWTEITPPGRSGQAETYALAVDGSTAGRLYVSNSRVTLLANGSSTQRQIWRTDNAGDAWVTTGFHTATGNDFPQAMIADPLTPGTIYAVAEDFAGVYKSVNEGKTFKEVLGGANGSRLVFGQKDKFNPRTLYLLSTDPNTGRPVIMRTTNGGTAWDSDTTVPTGTVKLIDIAADPATSSLFALSVVATSNPAGYALAVFQSPNRGFTWTNVTGNLPSTVAIDITGAVSTPPLLRASGPDLFVGRPLQATLSISPIK